MGVYLNKLQTTVNTVQSKQIMSLLLKEKDSGKLQTLEEFQARLATLTTKLLSEKITPTLKVFLAELDDIIDIDTYNFMLERIKDDLTTIFTEADNLESILSAHHNIINDVILRAIRYGLSELEDKISQYELLSGDQDGLDNAQFNTFRASKNLSFARTNPNSEFLFIDPITNHPILNDAIIDLNGERLIAGYSKIEYLKIKKAEYYPESHPFSIDPVSSKTTDINKILDDTPGTFWLYSALHTQKLPLSLLVDIKLELNKFSDINFIELEAANTKPVRLTNILKSEPGFPTTTIATPNIDVTDTTKIHFIDTSVSNIFIILAQSNFTEVQYQPKKRFTAFEAGLTQDPFVVPDVETIEKELQENLTSKLLLNDIMVAESAPSTTPDPVAEQANFVKYFDYTLGLDNIRVGKADYTESSIFVSTPITVSKLNQIALKTKEQRPYFFSPGQLSYITDTDPARIIFNQNGLINGDPSDVNQDPLTAPATNSLVDLLPYTFLTSLEYNVSLQHFDKQDNLIGANIVPILPYATSYILHERFIPTLSSGTALPNVGFLRFFTKINPSGNNPGITVWKNMTQMSPSDYIIDDPESGSYMGFSYTASGNVDKKIHRIAIILASPPSPNDFITVSYTPSYSTTRADALNSYSALTTIHPNIGAMQLRSIDLTPDSSLVHGRNHVIYVSDKKNNKDIEYTKVQLIVILRKNSHESYLTSMLDEYVLLTSSRVEDKFDV